jgi:hypothetical protein
LQRGAGSRNPLDVSAFYLNSKFAIDGSIQLPKLANRYATEPGAVATALNYEYDYDTNAG